MRSTSCLAISSLLFLSVQATSNNRPGPSTATEVFSVKPLRGMPVANRPSPKSTSSSRSVVSFHSTTHASSTPAPTPSPPTTTATAQPSPVSNISKKKGLGFNTNSYLNGFGNSLSWCYNWANAPWGPIPAGVEFTPMLWGSDSSGWNAAANSAINSGSLHLLGMNEPDLNVQANMTPAEAAAEWKSQMQPFAGRVKLVSPAITNGGDPMGFAWLAAFFKACDGCHFDAMAMHWYDSATNTGYFTQHLEAAHAQFGLPIWLTEFAGSGSVAQQQSFLEYVVPWMEKTAYIERYAAFGAFAGMFVNNDGSLTPLGFTYKNTV